MEQKPVLSQDEIDAILETYGDDPTVAQLMKQMALSQGLASNSLQYSKSPVGALASGMFGYMHGKDRAAVDAAQKSMTGRVKGGRRAGMDAILKGLGSGTANEGALSPSPEMPVYGDSFE